MYRLCTAKRLSSCFVQNAIIMVVFVVVVVAVYRLTEKVRYHLFCIECERKRLCHLFCIECEWKQFV